MSDPNRIPTLTTPGVLAKQLGEPLHRVLHVLRTRKDIRPSARAGRLRLFDSAAVEAVAAALAEIDRRAGRAGRKGGRR